jgi:hypothetical protein
MALFERTITTMRKNVLDLDRVSEVLHLDDGSSSEDLLGMRKLLAESVPGARLRTIGDIQFPNRAHHACMMQTWHDLVSPADFVFHCEDDWEFTSGGKLISAAIELMEAAPAIGQVGIWRKPPTQGIMSLDGIRYWEWQHDPMMEFRHRLQHEDDIDPAWPHFSLRPSIIRCETLRRVGNFQQERFFEHAFARRWTGLGWKTVFLAAKHCFHQAPGPGRSAYDIAGTLR